MVDTKAQPTFDFQDISSPYTLWVTNSHLIGLMSWSTELERTL